MAEVVGTYFGKNGTEVKTEDSAMAKILKGELTRYYIRYNKLGEGAGRPHNPHISRTDFSRSRMGDIFPTTVFRKVNKDAFDIYVTFLKTKSMVTYKAAEYHGNNGVG